MADEPERENDIAGPEQVTPADDPQPPEVPQVSFGTAGSPLPDWRDGADADEADDDEEMTETPPDVVEMLGFDPLELAEDEDTDSADAPARADSVRRYVTLSVHDAMTAAAVGSHPEAYATGTLKTAAAMLRSRPGFDALLAAIHAEIAAR